jgi:hypothetical protein
MDHTMTAPRTRTSPEQILLLLVAARFACAPVSWIDDGVAEDFFAWPNAPRSDGR